MSENKIPDWVRTAARVDRPHIDAWYKVEDHGALDGVLIWHGQQEAVSGDVYNIYAIRLATTGKVVGVPERAGLRDLRAIRLGSRIFIRPTIIKDLGGGRKMQQFEIFSDQQEPLKRPDPRGGGGTPDGSASGSDDVPF